MPVGPVIERLARAFMEMRRQKLGIPQEEQVATASADNSALRRAQAAQILQTTGRIDEDRDLRRKLIEAQIRNYDEPNRLPPVPPKDSTPHYTTDEAGNVSAIVRQPDGTYVVRSLGKLGQRPADIRPDAPKAGAGNDGPKANPFIVRDPATGKDRYAVREGSGFKFLDDIGGTPIGVGPTADMRNTEAQATAVEPAFELVQKSLDSLKTAMGATGSTIAGMVPGTQTYYAKTRFQDQAKALLGAIVARQAGEGSRLSDEDRKAYSQASTLVNNVILLPGGVEEAQARLNDARSLLDQVIARRKMSGTQTGTPSGAVSGAPRSTFRVIGKRPKQ